MVFSPTTVIGAAVLEYGPTEILPQVGALSKHAERLCRPGPKPAAHTRAESRGSGPSKVDAAERQTLCWRKPDSNHRFRLRYSPSRDRPLSSPRTFPRFPPENEVRSGLSAGGKEIRTAGPSRIGGGFQNSTLSIPQAVNRPTPTGEGR